MVKQGIVADFENNILQAAQVFYSRLFFARNRVGKYKIAKTKIIGNDFAQFHHLCFRHFVDKSRFHLIGQLVIILVGRLNNKGNKRVLFANFTTKFNAGSRIFDAVFLIIHIGNHTQHIALIFGVNLHSFLVIAGKQDFGTTTHSQHLFVCIESFGHERTRLNKHILVQMRQNGRIKPHRILYKKDDLHSHRLYIFFHIHCIFYQFDNCQ